VTGPVNYWGFFRRDTAKPLVVRQMTSLTRFEQGSVFWGSKNKILVHILIQLFSQTCNFLAMCSVWEIPQERSRPPLGSWQKRNIIEMDHTLLGKTQCNETLNLWTQHGKTSLSRHLTVNNGKNGLPNVLVTGSIKVYR